MVHFRQLENIAWRNYSVYWHVNKYKIKLTQRNKNWTKKDRLTNKNIKNASHIKIPTSNLNLNK